MLHEEVAFISTQWDGAKRTWKISLLDWTFNVVREVTAPSINAMYRVVDALKTEHPYVSDLGI